MLGAVLARGMQITSDADDADVLIVTRVRSSMRQNESIEAILEAHQARGFAQEEGAEVDRERLHVATFLDRTRA